MWRHIASNALTFFVVLLFLAGGVVMWGRSQYLSEGPLEQAICVQVERGTNFRAVSRNLEDQGAVTSGAILRIGADYMDKTRDLKAGSFLVPEGASMANIVDIVTRGGASTCGTEIIFRIGVTAAEIEVRELDPASGRYVERAEFAPADAEANPVYAEMRKKDDTRYRVALAEGVTSWQVVQELASLNLLDGEAEVPAEGSLAPDSYEIRPGDTLESVITRMQSAQEAILADAWAGRTGDLPLETPEDALILASIIEKETGNAEERGQVASVFTNRLRAGMPLQTDPTVIYGVTEGKGVLGRGLRRSELDRETPWNTYVITGLPPTPIANPGRASIVAALNPAETEFIYFVARTLNPADGHNFAVTLDEHNRNVAAYRALEAQRNQ